MNSGLEPEELTRLLRAAVEPIRASPDALAQIRAGVERRQWWRLPLMATGGVVMAALILLAFMAVRPETESSQVVEPAGPPLLASSSAEPSRPSVSTTPGGGGSGGHNGGSGGTLPRRTTEPPTATSPSTSPNPTPSPSATSPTGGPGGSGSATLPTPVSRPAGPNDVDGDGNPDQVRINGTRVEITFSRGGTDAVDLPGVPVPASYAVVDANHDGFAEILVRTASRDGIDDYTLLRYAARGDLAPATPGAGVRLSAGTRDGNGFGFRCDGDGLRAVAGTTTDGTTFQLVTTVLQITPDGLVAGQTSQSQESGSNGSLQFVPNCGSLS